MCVFAFFHARHHPTVCCSLVRHQAEIGGEIKNRASGSLLPFRRCHGFSFRRVFDALSRAACCLPVSEASSKRQGDGQRFQKKAMNTTNLKNEAAAPASVRPSSVSKTRAFAAHRANRELPTQTVLDLLKAQLPTQYELVEIVGRWVWLDFPAHTHRAAANVLWRLGFHWNQRRCLWQHPFGACAPYNVHSGDPRSKYGSRPAFTLNA